MRRPSLFLLISSSAALVVVAVLLAHMRVRAAASRLPERGSAVTRVAGLAEDVEVVLDDRGVPHIRAARETDLWLAQGYVHARDRFFQMDVARRTAQGRLAEVFGEAILAEDRKARVWRLAATARRQHAQLGPREREALEAYAAGVNAALERFGRWIAPETWLIGLAPEPWLAEDSLAIVALLQLRLSGAMGAELERAVTLARLGRERAVDQWGWTPSEADAWIPPNPQTSTPIQADDAITPSFAGLGSNSWVIAGSRTASGRPLIANDPHFAVQLPASWYAVHLRAPELHVAGASLAGVPGVVIGHTEGVAWGLTMTMLDDQDLFSLSLDETRGREKVDGSWQPLQTVTEQIAVFGREEPELLKVRLSERGPIVRDSNREVLALSWSGLHGPSPVRAFLRMDRATSVADVTTAWDGVTGPCMNLVAADVSGHILHQVVGQVPERDRGAGRLPAPGADSRWAWRGFLPTAANPYQVDPGEGFMVTANHDLFAEGDYPAEERFPGEFAPPWRARRIRKALASTTKWSVEDCVRLQGDTASPRARAVLELLGPELARHGGSTATALLRWDGRMDRASVAAHLYARLMLELADQIGGDEALRDGLGTSPIGAEHVLRLLVGAMDETWWDDVATVDTEGRQEIVLRALDGIDEQHLHRPWGEVHEVRFSHPFQALPVVGPLLGRSWSRGPYPVAGDGTTVNAHYWGRQRPFQVVAIPSMRFVADVGDWDATVLVLPLGQSGRPWSMHYADQVGAWLWVEALRQPFTDGAVERAARARLILRP